MTSVVLISFRFLFIFLFCNKTVLNWNIFVPYPFSFDFFVFSLLPYFFPLLIHLPPTSYEFSLAFLTYAVLCTHAILPTELNPRPLIHIALPTPLILKLLACEWIRKWSTALRNLRIKQRRRYLCLVYTHAKLNLAR